MPRWWHCCSREACRGRNAAQVISDYRTVKALLPEMGQSAQGGVWYNLVQEVEKVTYLLLLNSPGLVLFAFLGCMVHILAMPMWSTTP